MSPIYCEHPVLIVNPRLPKPEYCYCVLRGHHVITPPSAKRAHVHLDELDQCTVTNIMSGEVLPMYIAVPCGKCALCRHRKAKMWMSRCTCESQYHELPPVFCTLTYFEKYLPSDGVCLEDFQKFMKRLRITLCRSGKNPAVRFIASGEYGRNYGRPHYHVLLWGMSYSPDRFYDTWKFLKRVWSFEITKEEYLLARMDKVERDLVFYEDVPDRRTRSGYRTVYRHQFGFVQAAPAKDSSGAYVAKYLTKDSPNPCGYKNDTFFISSRRNGIGFKYAVENYKYYSEHVDDMVLTIRDKFSGKLVYCVMPDYYKRIWFPTPSTFVSPILRKKLNYIEDLACLLRFLRFAIPRLTNDEYLINDDVDELLMKVNSHYSFLKPLESNEYKLDKTYVFEQLHVCYKHDLLLVTSKYSEENLIAGYRVNYLAYIRAVNEILDVAVPIESINSQLQCTENRKKYISSIPDSQKRYYDIPWEVAKIRKEIHNQKTREVF